MSKFLTSVGSLLLVVGSTGLACEPLKSPPKAGKQELRADIAQNVEPVKSLACSRTPVTLTISKAEAGKKPSDAYLADATRLGYTSIVRQGQNYQITASVKTDNKMPKNLVLSVTAKSPSGTGEVGFSTSEQTLGWNSSAKTIIKNIKSGWVKDVGVDYKLVRNGTVDAIAGRGTITYTLTGQN